MSKSRELRAARAELVIKAQTIMDAPGMRTAEEQGKIAELIAQAQAMELQITQAEQLETMTAELGTLRAPQTQPNGAPRIASADETAARIAQDKRILRAYLADRFDMLSSVDREAFNNRRIQAAASIGTNTAGGYTVAPEFQRELLIVQKAFGGMRDISRSFTTDTGVDLPWPTMDDTSNVATIVAENTAGAAATDLVFGQKIMKAWMYRSGYFLVSLEMLQDSEFDFDSMIRDAMANRFARGQNAHMTNGNGTAQPQGITVGATTGVTGATGNTVAVTVAALTALIHSIDPAYRKNCKWMFHDTTLQFLRGLTDTQNRPLWVDNLINGIPSTLLGYPYVINQDMPVMAANAKSIAFGDFTNYLIRDVMGLRILRLNERFAENAQVGFVAFQRMDGRLVSAASPVKLYVNSAT